MRNGNGSNFGLSGVNTDTNTSYTSHQFRSPTPGSASHLQDTGSAERSPSPLNQLGGSEHSSDAIASEDPRDQTATARLSKLTAVSSDLFVPSEASPNDGAAPAEPNIPSIYPNFDDGDVRITSPTGRSWKLHSMMLGNASPCFKKIFRESAPYPCTKKMLLERTTIRWQLLMYSEPRAFDLDPDGLQFKNFEFLERGTKKNAMRIPDNINGLGVSEGYNKLYDNLFRCIYNLEPIFTSDIDAFGEGKKFILDASTLLQAADFLDAVSAVRVIIEAHLLRLNQLLWHHISNRPEGWVHLAARLQSPLMFREAMLHIVGRFDSVDGIDKELLQRSSFGNSGHKIWQLIVDKARQLKHTKLSVERRLLEFYPPRMIHRDDEGDYVPGRATYANDIYLWIGICLFRQYVTSACLSNFHHRGSDGGTSLYRTIGSMEDSYLRADTLQRFHVCFDMSAKGKACLIQAVESIKSDVKPLLACLLLDRSQVTRDPHAPRLQYLTCTEILDIELPWYVPPPAPAADVEMSEEMGM